MGEAGLLAQCHCCSHRSYHTRLLLRPACHAQNLLQVWEVSHSGHHMGRIHRLLRWHLWWRFHSCCHSYRDLNRHQRQRMDFVPLDYRRFSRISDLQCSSSISKRRGSWTLLCLQYLFELPVPVARKKPNSWSEPWKRANGPDLSYSTLRYIRYIRNVAHQTLKLNLQGFEMPN